MYHETSRAAHLRSAKAVAILQIAQEAHLALRRVGAAYMSLCPFHSESHPSFAIFPATNTWYCFGCRRHGDGIDFVRELTQLDFPHALEWLSQRSSYAVPKILQHRSAFQPPLDPEVCQQVLAIASTRYHTSLLRSPHARAYLAQRGVSDSLIKTLRLGFCDGTQRYSLQEHCRKAGIRAEALREAGILGNAGVERFRDRIIIPAFQEGRVVWLTGRSIAQREPRYVNLTGPKPLLGLDSLDDRGYVIVAEGVFDYLTLRSWGYPTVSAGGGSLSLSQREALPERLTKVIAFDTDAAGRHAAADLAATFAASAKLLTLPPDVKDINELGVQPHGKARFHACLTALWEDVP